MRYQEMQRALICDMRRLAEMLTGQKGNRIACPFHDDDSRSMIVYRDHVYCPECGTYSPVSFVTKMKGIGQDEAARYIEEMESSPDGVLRNMLIEFARRLKPEWGEGYGYIPAAIIPTFPKLAGLENGKAVMLTHGFACKGKVFGDPELDLVNGDGDYILYTKDYEKALAESRNGTDAYVGDWHRLAGFGRPVITDAEDAETAREMARAGIAAGVRRRTKNGEWETRWLKTGKRKEEEERPIHSERTVIYRSDGDFVNAFRQVYGVDPERLESIDAWLMMTGQDLDFDVSSILASPSPGSAMTGRWHVCNGRRRTLTVEDMEIPPMECASTEKKRMLSLERPPRQPLRFRNAPRNRSYIRFSFHSVISVTGGRILMKGKNGVLYDASIEDVYRYSSRKQDFLYLDQKAPVRCYRETENGMEETERPPMPPRIRMRRFLTNRRTDIVYLDDSVMTREGDRIRIEIGNGHHIMTKERYVIPMSTGGARLLIRNGYTFPEIDRDGRYVIDDGKEQRMGYRDIQAAMHRILDRDRHND